MHLEFEATLVLRLGSEDVCIFDGALLVWHS